MGSLNVAQVTILASDLICAELTASKIEWTGLVRYIEGLDEIPDLITVKQEESPTSRSLGDSIDHVTPEVECTGSMWWSDAIEDVQEFHAVKREEASVSESGAQEVECTGSFRYIEEFDDWSDFSFVRLEEASTSQALGSLG